MNGCANDENTALLPPGIVFAENPFLAGLRQSSQ
jgi:hypothetical protein